MITEMNLKFSQILEKAYAKWREKQGIGENKSEAEFARWLGFSPQTVSTWKRRSPPSDEVAIGQLGIKLKKLDKELAQELYKSLGIDDPWDIETKALIDTFKDDEAFFNAANKLHEIAAKIDERLRRKK